MLGALPTTLKVNGNTYDIQTDYRCILNIFTAFESSELNDREKAYVLLHNIYGDVRKIPIQDQKEAYEKAVEFIDCYSHDDSKPGVKTINWEKDEQIMFPAINKVAGCEIRSVDYLHWWTFLGYFQGIDRDDLWGYVLTLRQKKANRKTLEKHEKEFWKANRAICELENQSKSITEDVNKTLNDLFNDLLQKGG